MPPTSASAPGPVSATDPATDAFPRDPVPPSRFPGPEVLGRNVVVGPGAPTPTGYADARRLTIDDAVLADPAATVAVLRTRWLHRRRTVLELTADNDRLRAPETTDTPPYALPRDHAFHREALHLLLWANSYDLRDGTPRWWHGVLATRRTAAVEGDLADLRLPDGRHAFVDGGPRGPLPGPLPDLGAPGPGSGADGAPPALVHRESIGLGRLTVQGGAQPTELLAPDQLAAGSHGVGPARLIAPAGSGKTRVLTARLRHLLRDRGVEPELITALAYNTRAAEEMRVRTRDLDASIRTLHSLALRICSLDQTRQVIGERDVRRLLDRLVRTARIPNQDPFQPYLEALAEVRLALCDPAEVETRRGDVDGFVEVFERYRELLARERLLDFDEQIYRAIELLLTDPEVRRTAQRWGTHLLVDEFQDLTPAFLLLVRLVAGPSLQVFAVGDDDQTIYSYAGATPEHLTSFARWFPGASHHALEVNYRCPPPVVEGAVRLLEHNRHRVPKTIRAHPDSHPGTHPGATTSEGEQLSVHRVAGGSMAHRTVAILRERLAAEDPPDHLAVLARVNSALLPVQVALTEAGVPHTAPLDDRVLQRTGVRTALAYLRLGLDTDRILRNDVMETLNRPARKVRSAVTPHLPRGNRWSLAALEQVADRLDGTHRERFLGYLGDLRHLEEAITDGADTARCLWVIRNRIGLGEAMDALDASRSRPEGSSHGDDLDALEQLAALQPDPAAFGAWLTERLSVPGDPAGITLSTVHRVKGMEWSTVVVFAANQGLFPHRLADDREEERRVFHVALTRCQRAVHVVADRERTSPFVDELSPGAPHTRSAPATAASTAPGSVSDTDTDAPTGPDAAPVTPPVTPSFHADGRLCAVRGVEVTMTGGIVGRITALGRQHAVITVTEDDLATTLRLPHGSPVTVQGRDVRLGPPPVRAGAGTGRTEGAAEGGGDQPEMDDRLFEALRAWRTTVASRNGVPPYLVFHDRHLQVLAGRRPRTLSELATCPGVGPVKLERYGDDLLDLVAEHLD